MAYLQGNVTLDPACPLTFRKVASYLVLMMFLLSIATLNEVKSETTPKKEFPDGVLDFLQANGKKFLTFATLENEEPAVREALHSLVRKSKLTTKLRSRVLPSKDIKTLHRFHQDTLVLVASSKSKEWEKYVNIVAETKIMSSIIVCIGELQSQKFKKVSMSLRKKSKNAFFYWVGVEGKKFQIIDWKQMMSVKNSKTTISKELKFHSF